MKRRIVWLFALGSLFSLLFLLHGVEEYNSWNYKNRSIAQRDALLDAKKLVQSISQTLTMVEKSAQTLAEELSSGKTTLSTLIDRQRAISEKNFRIFGLGAAFKPTQIKSQWASTYGMGEPGSSMDGEGGRLTKANLCVEKGLESFLYAPYLRRVDQDVESRKVVFVNNSYDYTCKEKYWYTCPLGLYPEVCPKPSGEMWLEPYFGEASQRMVEEYSVPFYDFNNKDDKNNKKNPVGVVWANLSLDDFTGLLASMNAGQTGYSFILSARGVYIAHPLGSYTERGKSIFQELREEGESELSLLFEMAKTSGTQMGDHKDPLSGKGAWWIFEPVQQAGWVVGVVFIKDDLMGSPEEQRRRLMVLIFGLLLVVLMGSLLMTALFDHNHTGWLRVIIVSVVLMLLVASLVYLSVLYPDFNAINKPQVQNTIRLQVRGKGKAVVNQSLPLKNDANTFFKGFGFLTSIQEKIQPSRWPSQIVSQVQLDQFQERYLKYTGRLGVLKERKVVFLPTGLVIQSINPTLTNGFQLSGYVWQNLPPPPKQCASKPKTRGGELVFYVLKQGVCKTIQAGVRFPETSNTPLQEIYRHTNKDGGVVVAWSFDRVLPSKNRYEQYPFDVANLSIRFWPKDADFEGVLVPDIAAYPMMNPAVLPGIVDGLMVRVWQVEGSFFGFEGRSYDAYPKVGLGKHWADENFPELHFDILLKRYFMSMFVADIIPILLISVSLFLLLFLDRTFFPHLLSISTVLLMSILLAHTRLRWTIESPGFVYMEKYYLILYMALLAVVIHACFVRFWANGSQWLEKDLAKRIYWPAILSLVVWITIESFY